MTKKTSSKKKFISLNEDKENNDLIIRVSHKNNGQKEALRIIDKNKVSFLFGPPGTGKTHLAVGWGLQELINKNSFKKIIFTRPYVEAGEKLGFLPGSYDEKVAPFMLPIYDVLLKHITTKEIKMLEDNKRIVVLPLAYMRGVTFNDSYVVIDEAQNTSVKQMHLFLTRLGQGSKIVVTGDVFQTDLRFQVNGLLDALIRLNGIDDIGMCYLDGSCNVRDPIISSIDEKYRDMDISLKPEDNKFAIKEIIESLKYREKEQDK